MTEPLGSRLRADAVPGGGARRDVESRQRHLALAATLFLALSLLARPALGEVKVTAVEPVLRVSPVTTQDTTLFRLEVIGVPPPAGPVTLTDKAMPKRLGTVTFENPRVVGPLPEVPGAFQIVALAVVKGLPPLATQERVVQVTIPNVAAPQEVPFTLTSNTGKFTWSVIPPADPWVLEPKGSTTITVRTGDVPATAVRLAQSTLLDETSKNSISLDQLELCKDKCDDQCAATYFVPARTTQPLLLCNPKPFPAHGVYRGKLTLTTGEDVEGKELVMSVAASSTCRKWVGVALVFAGVIVAGLVKFFGPARVSRNQALLPMLFQRRSLLALQEQLASVPAQYQAAVEPLTKEVSDLLIETDDGWLTDQGLIPPRIPLTGGGGVNVGKLAAHVEKLDRGVQVLAVLVKEGVIPFLEWAVGTGSPPADVLTALADTAKIARETPRVDITQARDRLATIRTTLHATGKRQFDAAAQARQPRQPVTLETAQFEISAISAGTWLVTALLTVLAGGLVLVANHPGFGSASDLVVCFFWGFGIPTAVGQLTPSSVATAIGVTYPRV